MLYVKITNWERRKPKQLPARSSTQVFTRKTWVKVLRNKFPIFAILKYDFAHPKWTLLLYRPSDQCAFLHCCHHYSSLPPSFLIFSLGCTGRIAVELDRILTEHSGNWITSKMFTKIYKITGKLRGRKRGSFENNKKLIKWEEPPHHFNRNVTD